MQTSNTSWHFKLANEYGGLKHKNGYSYPSLCHYIFCCVTGLIGMVFDRVIFRWVFPLFLDFAFLLAVFFIFNNDILLGGLIFIVFYGFVIFAIHYDFRMYVGPFFVLGRFKIVQKLKPLLCQPVKIVYAKEEN